MRLERRTKCPARLRHVQMLHEDHEGAEGTGAQQAGALPSSQWPLLVESATQHVSARSRRRTAAQPLCVLEIMQRAPLQAGALPSSQLGCAAARGCASRACHAATSAKCNPR